MPHLLRLGLAVRQQTAVGCSKGENRALSQVCVAPADLSSCPDKVKLAERSVPTVSSGKLKAGDLGMDISGQRNTCVASVSISLCRSG